MELKPGDVINLGVGMPAEVSKIVAEEGFTDDVTMSTESGMVGGVPSPLPSFGSAYNPQAIITPNDMFDFISGGGLDVTCLGIGEVDEEGNNNVSRMGKRLTGPGGFIDITSATKKVIFGLEYSLRHDDAGSMTHTFHVTKCLQHTVADAHGAAAGCHCHRVNVHHLYVTAEAHHLVPDGMLEPHPAIFEEDWGGLSAYFAAE